MDSNISKSSSIHMLSLSTSSPYHCLEYPSTPSATAITTRTSTRVATAVRNDVVVEEKSVLLDERFVLLIILDITFFGRIVFLPDIVVNYQSWRNIVMISAEHSLKQVHELRLY